MSHEWMRNRMVDIMEYLPQFLSKDNNFKSINDADSIEHNSIRLDLQDLLNQLHIGTATWGLDKWEDTVGLPISKSTNYIKRRARILAIINANYSVTLEFMQSLVEKYVVDNSCKVVDVSSDYRIDIYIQDGMVLSWEDLQKALRIWVPAHIGWRFVARTEVQGGIYGRGVVSVGDIYTIEASAEYDIDDQDGGLHSAGAVSVADIYHVNANVYQ